MKIIDVKKIENMNLQKTKVYGSEADIYYIGDYCYKRFKDKDADYLLDKMNKINFLSNLELGNAILPLAIGFNYEENIIDGYFMKYFKNAPTLYNISKFTKFTEFVKFMYLVNNTSEALKRLHSKKEGIILGDASYQNIIIRKDDLGILSPLFIDIDSALINENYCKCKYKTLSELLNNYYATIGLNESNPNKNTDRLTHLLYYLNAFFALDIIELPIYEYDRMCELSNTLKNLRSIVLELKHVEDENHIPYIPYMHEVLDLTDIYGLNLK